MNGNFMVTAKPCVLLHITDIPYNLRNYFRITLAHINFPKIHRSVLRKTAIGLLYFEALLTSIYRKKYSAEVRLIYAKQISLYKFHHFIKKLIDTAED